ncbi:hypothetical protein Hanom_Chr03g00270141 [Helianthus anomalus]
MSPVLLVVGHEEKQTIKTFIKSQNLSLFMELRKPSTLEKKTCTRFVYATCLDM